MEIREYTDFDRDEIRRLYERAGWTAYTNNMPALEQWFKNSLSVLAAYPIGWRMGGTLSGFTAGLLIAFRVSDVYVSHIGLTVGRGALISVLLVLTVLPQLILLFDRAIDKTTFQLPAEQGGEEQ